MATDLLMSHAVCSIKQDISFSSSNNSNGRVMHSRKHMSIIVEKEEAIVVVVAEKTETGYWHRMQ